MRVIIKYPILVNVSSQQTRHFRLMYKKTRYSILTGLKRPEDKEVWRQSWSRFFDAYHEFIQETINHIGKSYLLPSDTDELVYEVMCSFQKTQEGPNPYNPKRTDDTKQARLSTYITDICRKRVIDRIRAIKRKPDYLNAMESENHGRDEGLEQIAEELQARPINERNRETYDQALLISLLEDTLNECSFRDRHIFVKCKLEGAEAKAVAEEYDISQNAVNNVNHRIIGKMKELAKDPAFASEVFSDRILADFLLEGKERKKLTQEIIHDFINILKKAYRKNEMVVQSDSHIKIANRISTLIQLDTSF